MRPWPRSVRCKAPFARPRGDIQGKVLGILFHRSEALSLADCIPQIWYSSTIVFLLALGLSKITCVLAVLRLTASTCNTRIQYLSYLLVVLTGIWTFVGIIVFSTRCDMPHPWKMFGQGCNGAVSQARRSYNSRAFES